MRAAASKHIGCFVIKLLDKLLRFCVFVAQFLVAIEDLAGLGAIFALQQAVDGAHVRGRINFGHELYAFLFGIAHQLLNLRGAVKRFACGGVGVAAIGVLFGVACELPQRGAF